MCPSAVVGCDVVLRASAPGADGVFKGGRLEVPVVLKRWIEGLVR